MADLKTNSADRKSERGHDLLSPSAWIAFAAVAIALCALGLSFYEGYWNRKHQKLSVKPYVKVVFHYNDAGAHYAMDNWGLGPALMYWFRASVDGQPKGTWREVLSAIGLSKDVRIWQSIPAKGVMMPPISLGNPINILTVEPGNDAEMLINNAQRIELEACYCSPVYNDCWVISTHSSNPDTRKSCEPAPKTQFEWER